MRAEENKPINEIRIGSIRASIWLNRPETGMPWYTVTASRSYRDKKGDWRDVRSFNYSDLPCVGEVLEQAMSWIRDQIVIDVHEAVPGHAMDEGTKAKASSAGRKKRRSK
tara:strand:- start:182 stop:511 length:330 start_codon:yes stop_codon:yes gene_type:complete